MKGASLLFVLLMFAEAGLANPGQDAWNAYLAGDFKKTAAIAQKFGSDSSLTPVERAEIYFALAFGQVITGDSLDASFSLRAGFSLDRTREYTSDDLPPKVWRFYIEHRPTIQSSPIASPPVEPTGDLTGITRDSLPRSPALPYRLSTSAVTRSLLLPGWGHLTEGDRGGALITIGSLALAGGWIWSELHLRKSNQSYMDASQASTARTRYRDYRSAYQIAWAFRITSLAYYLAAQYDFFTLSKNLTTTPTGLAVKF